MKYRVVTGNDIEDFLTLSEPFGTIEEAREHLKSIAYTTAKAMGVDVLSRDFRWAKDEFTIFVNGDKYSGNIVSLDDSLDRLKWLV